MISLIDLPSPQPLLPSLLEAGFNHEIATIAGQLYQQRAEEFKRRAETALIAAWQGIATLPGASASSLDLLAKKDVANFTKVYLRCLEEWKEEMAQLLKQASSKMPSKAAPSRNSRSFNHEYLPLLEHFFDENPFPTHADKVFLAKKSNMQYKQIHVWFQNRRSRTKKEAKSLRKKPKSEGAIKPLDNLYERMMGHVVKPITVSQNPQACLAGSDDEIRTTRYNAQKCAFISPPPPHAFPSSYPPTCISDPFPCKSGLMSFKSPEWRRVPCSKSHPSVTLSMDDLVERFSQLNVRSDTRARGSPEPRSHAATAAITVIPSCAPHPSLVVHKHPKFAPVIALSCASTQCSQTLKPTSRAIIPISVSCPSYGSEPSAKRKISPLPQRFPGRMQNVERDPTTSEYSYTPLSCRMFSTRPGSRSCSFASISLSSSPTNMASIRQLPRSPSCSPLGRPLLPVFLET